MNKQENYLLKKHVNGVYICTLFYNNKGMESAYMSTIRLVSNKNGAHMCNEIIFSHMKNELLKMCWKTGGTGIQGIQQSDPGSGRKTVCVLSHVCVPASNLSICTQVFVDMKKSKKLEGGPCD